MKTTKEILIAGRALIANPENWIQQEFARDKNGMRVEEDHPEAVCFCSWGAVCRVVGHFIDRDSAPMVYLKESMGGSVPHFNDTHTHAEVLAAWDTAIANIKE